MTAPSVVAFGVVILAGLGVLALVGTSAYIHRNRERDAEYIDVEAEA